MLRFTSGKLQTSNPIRPSRLQYAAYAAERKATMKLYVGNLAFATSETGLKEAFAAFGTVDSASIISDRETGRSKGFGFIEMNNDEEAKAAIDGMNGQQLDGRAVRVSEARPKEDRPRGGNRGGSRW